MCRFGACVCVCVRVSDGVKSMTKTTTATEFAFRRYGHNDINCIIEFGFPIDTVISSALTFPGLPHIVVEMTLRWTSCMQMENCQFRRKLNLCLSQRGLDWNSTRIDSHYRWNWGKVNETRTASNGQNNKTVDCVSSRWWEMWLRRQQTSDYNDYGNGNNKFDVCSPNDVRPTTDLVLNVAPLTLTVIWHLRSTSNSPRSMHNKAKPAESM